ncbi:MAG: amidohydrolase family protein [Xanthobacteraceae bacterium]|nr:amidohydrolase family protein [Xanthobacteraceae bacterium]
MTHMFDSGCPCCLPRQALPGDGLSRRQFLCTTAAGAAAAPAIAASVIGTATEAQAQAAKPARAGRPTLIRGGIVLSLDRAVGDFEQADVLIEGKKIAAVGPNLNAPNAQVIDAKNRIVMPGFVDTHRHMWQGFLRNVLPDGSLEDYRNVVQRTFGAKMVPDDVYAADLISALGAIDSGVTCVLDWSHIGNSPEHTDACIKGLQESGVRAVFAYGAGQNESGRVTEIATSKYPGDIARLRKQYFSSDDQLTTLYLAALGGTPEAALSQFKAARDVGARISIHVGVGEFGRSAFIEKVNALNGLKDDTTYIHCCTLNDTEWKLIKDTGGTVSIAGYVETLMGHGNPPTQKAIDLGIRPSLSVDVETSVPNDFFTQMRTIFSLQKNEVWARRLAGQKDAGKFLTAREVLEFATVEGARANGLDKKIGTLTPGKEADIILLRTDLLNTLPINNAVGAVVTSMTAQNVDTVLIAGKVVKRGGKLVGVDMNRIARLGRDAQARNYKAANVPDKRI